MATTKKLKSEYAEAMLIYATTAESLKSITDRFGLRYGTVANYIRRNYPAVITQHKALLPKDDECFAKGVKLLQTTNLSPYQVMKQLGYNRKFISYIQANHPKLQRHRIFNNGTKNRPSKIVKYAGAVAMLTEMKKQQCNVVRKIAVQLGLNYDSFRMYLYSYHRELIGLEPERNNVSSRPSAAAKYAEAVSLLAATPKQPDNYILYVADNLGLNYHALRRYIYDHHPELAQKRRKNQAV